MLFWFPGFGWIVFPAPSIRERFITGGEELPVMPSEPREFYPRGERGKVLIRRFSTFEDYLACERLQVDIRGKGFHGLVPSSILLVSQEIGGIAAGAFDGKGTLIGFVFGMAGYGEGKPIHWSDMLAVNPGWRDSTRHAFVHYLDRGYRVRAFGPAPPGNRFFYLLTSTSSAAAAI